MVVFDFVDDSCVPTSAWQGESLFPENSVLLNRTPFSLLIHWEPFLAACHKLADQCKTFDWIFIDATWDPVWPTDVEIVYRRYQLSKIFPWAKIVILSAKAQHWFHAPQGVLYVPFFAIRKYPKLVFLPRRGRIGCLNRRNAIHRVRLMYHLLDQGLLDSQRDIYSVSFVGLNSNLLFNFEGSKYAYMEQKLRTWPGQIATHPDNFINDYSISHPAWHTGIAIVTESYVDDLTLICEKTAKAILSKSCFSIYMAEVGYRLLEELGFYPRFFSNHAEYDNIDPLLDICRNIQTEQQAMDYRNQYLQQINYNFDWFGNDTSDVTARPWYKKFEPKLRQVLDNL